MGRRAIHKENEERYNYEPKHNNDYGKDEEVCDSDVLENESNQTYEYYYTNYLHKRRNCNEYPDDITTKTLNTNGNTNSRTAKPSRKTNLNYSILNSLYFILIVFIAIVLALVYFLHGSGKPNSFEVNVPELSSDEKAFEYYLDKQRDHFPSQNEDTWFTFQAGIKSVLRENPNKPAVFLLLHNGDGQTANCLAEKVILGGIEFLSGKQLQPIILQGEDLKTNKIFNLDSGEILNTYKSIVMDNVGMVVTDLHEVPGSIASAFHYFCDRESPLVQKAIYFFTLEDRGRQNHLMRSAQITMERLWNQSLTDNLLFPLITRLVGNVVQVKPESDLTMCSG